MAYIPTNAPAPQVLDEVTMDGRFGIVVSRLDGPTLLHLSRTGAMTRRQVGAILAILALSIHKMRPPPDVLLLRDWMDHTLRRTSDQLPERIATGILPWIERLSPGDGLCHGDIHPGNVIMTADGPRLIDWLGMVRAPPALDLAISHIILSEIAPDFADDPNRPRAVNAALQSEYARLAGTSLAALAASIEPYLPIVCVFALLGPAPNPAQRQRLIRRVEATLCAEDR